MNTNQSKYISRRIAPIAFGAVISILFHLVLFKFLSLIVSGKWEPPGFTIALFAFILPVGLGSFFTTFFFSETKIIHGILSSIVFGVVIIFPSITNFSHTMEHSEGMYVIWLFAVSIILIAGFLGSYIGIRLKKMRKIT